MKDYIFLIDFDKTITKTDSTDTIMEIYNEKLLREYQSQFRKGKMNIKEYLSGLLSNLNMDINEYQKVIAERVEIDNNFLEFLKLGYDFRIVSAGTYQNIFPILKKYNIKIEKKNIYSNEAIFENKKIRVEFPYDVEDCFEGVCKKTILQSYKKKYKKVIFIGDGSSDISVSDYADILFAKKGYKLEKYCIENKIKYEPYANFIDIIAYFK